MNPSENPSEVPYGATMSICEKLGKIDRDRLANLTLPPMEGEDIERVEQNTKKCSKEMTALPDGFKPKENDVICGRGRNIWNSIGNINFRRKVESRVEVYSTAATKLQKSAILSSIVAEIRKASPNGGFVRKDPKTGRWFEVGDFLAREKVSQSFRDVLHNSYRSSNKTKRKRRIEEQAKTAEINSELQRQALEELQSGKTDKNFYEIICHQQSMLQQSKQQRTSPKIHHEHVQSDSIVKPEPRLSDINTVRVLGSLPPFVDDSHYSFGRRSSDRNMQVQVLHAESFNTAILDSFEPLPIRLQETTHPDPSSHGQGIQAMNPQRTEKFDSGSEDDYSNRRLLDSLLAAFLVQADQGERDDDPFEPVPLPPEDIVSEDIDHIFN